MKGAAQFRFYAELNDFLPDDRRFTTFEADFAFGATVKDAVEALGVPHTEVDVVLVNDESVSFSHRVSPGDRLSVYPMFESFDVSPVTRLRPAPLRRPGFVVDANLGGLARYLRLLGFDAKYPKDLSDAELVAISVAERRVLLTRDVGALKHGALTHGYFVRERDPRSQVLEVVERFDLLGSVAPLSRCANCNGTLHPVAPSAVEHRLTPATRAHYDEYWLCKGCDKVYWRGSHVVAIERFVDEVRAASSRRA
jgi:uncharacterized protein with PIN domain